MVFPPPIQCNACQAIYHRRHHDYHIIALYGNHGIRQIVSWKPTTTYHWIWGSVMSHIAKALLLFLLTLGLFTMYIFTNIIALLFELNETAQRKLHCNGRRRDRERVQQQLYYKT